MEDAWGVGCYEDAAAQLQPAAEVAVAALELTPGAELLDVACGSGNAMVVGAAAGARVTGIDSSPRLVGVARERVPGAEAIVGDAAELPFADATFDAAVSVFGVIFAAPAERAAAEIVRVVRPGGRVAVTSWPPRGAVFDAVVLMRQALARVRGPQAGGGPPPVNWGDPAELARLFGPFGDVEISEQELVPERSTPEEMWDRWERLHPMWIGARRELEPAGEWDALREGSLAALRRGDGEPLPYLLTVLDVAA